MAASPIDIYRRQIERELQAGNATEHTHRPALKDLIESLEAGVTATNEPKRVECGAPDFIVSRKSVHGPMTLGYIEAKDVDKDLGEIEHSEQMKRYLPPGRGGVRKTDGAGDDCRRSGLAEGRRESFGPSRRGKIRRKGSVGDKREYTLRHRNTKKRIPARTGR